MNEVASADASAYSTRAVSRVCDLLDLVADSDQGLSLRAAAVGSGMPKSTAFRYLATLEERQYVQRDGEGNYILGPAFRYQDDRALDQLIEVSEPVLEALRDELGETTNLGRLDGSMIVHELVVESGHMMRLAARVGERGYVHSTALGKAICADSPELRVRALLDNAGMPRFTTSTITTPDAYIIELDRVRDLGYGVDDAENQEGGRCVAVAVPGTDLPCGISVSAPATRLLASDVPRIAARLHQAATDIGSRMSESRSVTK